MNSSARLGWGGGAVFGQGSHKNSPNFQEKLKPFTKINQPIFEPKSVIAWFMCICSLVFGLVYDTSRTVWPILACLSMGILIRSETNQGFEFFETFAVA